MEQINKQVILEARRQWGIFFKMKREEMGLSISEVSRRTGIDRKNIYNIESGSANYTIDSFFAYIYALDQYIFMTDKEDHHLDFDHMKEQSDPEKMFPADK